MSEDKQARLAEIEAREKAATPGPWREIPGSRIIQVHCITRDTWEIADCGFNQIERTKHNPEFIAHSRADIPWLIAELKAAWAREAIMREALESIARIEAYKGEKYWQTIEAEKALAKCSEGKME